MILGVTNYIYVVDDTGDVYPIGKNLNKLLNRVYKNGLVIQDVFIDSRLCALERDIANVIAELLNANNIKEVKPPMKPLARALDYLLRNFDYVDIAGFLDNYMKKYGHLRKDDFEVFVVKEGVSDKADLLKVFKVLRSGIKSP